MCESGRPPIAKSPRRIRARAGAGFHSAFVCAGPGATPAGWTEAEVSIHFLRAVLLITSVSLVLLYGCAVFQTFSFHAARALGPHTEDLMG